MYYASRNAVQSNTARYKPYECREKAVIINRTALKPIPSLFRDDDIAIEREEEHPAEDGPTSDILAPCTLSECFVKRVLDMVSAARVILALKMSQNFSEGSYKEFVRHVATQYIEEFCYRGFKEISNYVEYGDLSAESMQPMGDIVLAKSFFSERRLLSSLPEPNKSLSSHSVFSVANRSKSWILETDKPFVKVDLCGAALLWWKAKGQQLRAIAIIVSISADEGTHTDPPDAIKDYAVRLNGRNGKFSTLKNLPEVVERTLLDFAEDMLGYGREELRPGYVFDRSKSKFDLELGSTDNERIVAHDKLLKERSTWRSQLLRSLQRAMNGVRCRPHPT